MWTIGNNDLKLRDAIRNIQDAGLNIEDQGHQADYVGVNIKKTKDELNYLAQTTRPDIMYATHQVAKYSSDPRQSQKPFSI